jgi:branched-chain amino acid transport system ATP-binding protein
MAPLLELEETVKTFGSLTAVDSMSFTMDDECRSLIGPNGAGKTTLFNCICGIYTLDRGTVRFRGENVTEWSPDQMARNGMSRSFQISNLFDGFTAFENVRLASQIHNENNYNMWSNFSDLEEPSAMAEEILERIGLAEERETLVSSLSHGQKRQLEIGVVLATDPEIILLDEPTSGLSTENLHLVVDIIEDIRDEYPILLIEHNMDVVMDISDMIMVMDQGSLIAEGAPDEISGDEQVQEAYLGADLDVQSEQEEHL